MPGERTQRRIDRLIDRAEEAADQRDWSEVAKLARELLALDPDSEDASPLLRSAADGLDEAPAAETAAISSSAATPTSIVPDSFGGGRYQVERFLGEGGRKRVYVAHDELRDRDVAVALIKTEGLDQGPETRCGLTLPRSRQIREARSSLRELTTSPCCLKLRRCLVSRMRLGPC